MPENDLKLPSRSYWDGFKARNSAMWDKIKDNTFVNMFIPFLEIKDGNSIAAISAVVPGKLAATTAAKTIAKPLLKEATKSTEKKAILSSDEFMTFLRKDLSELTDNEAKLFYDALLERSHFALNRLRQVAEADRPRLVSYINKLHSRLNEFYEKGYNFVDKTHYRSSGPTIYVSNSASPKDAVIGNGKTYITEQPFHYKLGGSLRYISPSNKK